jgi:hypothetical protein
MKDDTDGSGAVKVSVRTEFLAIVLNVAVIIIVRK